MNSQFVALPHAYSLNFALWMPPRLLLSCS